jgi:hemerythrin-like metal-binding domain
MEKLCRWRREDILPRRGVRAVGVTLAGVSSTLGSVMPLVVWKEEFSIGVPMFDAEHQDLLDIINTLHDQAMAGAPADTLVATCDRLMAHTVTHFDHEEARFEGYPRAEEHRRMHTKLKERVAAFRREIAGTNAVDGTKLITDWLAHHITGEDKTFGAWIRGIH